MRALLAFIATSLGAAEPLAFPATAPTEAREAAKSFHVLEGFEMQLIAAEPLVTDPVAITYDENGRAYVCEMNDYPYTDKSAHKASQENPTDMNIGKVRLLTDTDGDGVFDKASVFAEGLSWPTGAACWKGGIFVTATPDVWYLKDTNDDGVADVKQKVFTGFKKLNVQAVMNNPIWGLDHRIYIAGGSNGGEIQRVPGSESVMPMPKDFKPLLIKRNDFSFDPSTGDVRLESGGARFGNTFDDWGNRFLCNIRNPCQHVVLPHRYLERNPYLVIPSALNDCAEAGDQLPVYRTSPPEPWREFRAKRWVQEGSHLPKSELVGAGVVTSSAGITVYRGDAYPKAYRDFAFVADVAGNLFYRMKLVPDGVTFKAVQVDGTKNFCTSDDVWFRPVNFVNAPDGCLHVCDMYREVIEHPWSIPDDIHAGIDLLKGKDKGRIWRLAPKGGATFQVARKDGQAGSLPHHRPTPKLGNASTSQLVTLLDHPNAWHRETAQRLLFERQDESAVEPLREVVKSGKTAQGRITALWSLWQCKSLDVAALVIGLKHEDEHVRSHALQLAYSHGGGYADEVVAAMPDASKESSRLVLFQQALWPDQSLSAASDSVRNASIEKHLDDPWLRAAALSDPFQWARATDLLDRMPDSESLAAYMSEAGKINGMVFDDQHTPELLEHLTDLWAKKPQACRAALLGWLEGSSKKGKRWDAASMDQKTKVILLDIFARELDRALNESGSLDDRKMSIRLASGLPLEKSAKPLLSLVASKHASEIQLAAIEALGSYQEPIIADKLIEVWPKLTPALRDKATTLLLSRTDRIARLLDAIEAKKIQPNQLSAAAKATLGRQKNPKLAERIAKLIGDGSSSNRKEVITQYTAALTMKGDAAQGAKVYETACMVCHKHKDRGNDVGPHLGTIQGWTAEQILTNVLDPNREVSPNFALYVIETHDGRFLSGLISSETAGNLTLKRADGGTDSVLRGEIKSLTSPGISLMPEGLEAAITPQQMADLIQFLRNT